MAFFCFLHPSLNDVSSKEHFWDTQLWIAISSFSINLLPSMMTIKFCVIKSFLMRFQSHVINVQFDEYWQSILSHFFSTDNSEVLNWRNTLMCLNLNYSLNVAARHFDVCLYSTHSATNESCRKEMKIDEWRWREITL